MIEVLKIKCLPQKRVPLSRNPFQIELSYPWDNQ